MDTNTSERGAALLEEFRAELATLEQAERVAIVDALIADLRRLPEPVEPVEPVEPAEPDDSAAELEMLDDPEDRLRAYIISKVPDVEADLLNEILESIRAHRELADLEAESYREHEGFAAWKQKWDAIRAKLPHVVWRSRERFIKNHARLYAEDAARVAGVALAITRAGQMINDLRAAGPFRHIGRKIFEIFDVLGWEHGVDLPAFSTLQRWIDLMWNRETGRRPPDCKSNERLRDYRYEHDEKLRKLAERIGSQAARRFTDQWNSIMKEVVSELIEEERLVREAHEKLVAKGVYPPGTPPPRLR